MPRLFFCLYILLPFFATAQHINLDTIAYPAARTSTVSLFSDSLSSSFLVVIPHEVKLHRHDLHSEQVYIIEGEGNMILGEKNFTVKKGDLIFIPKGTPHKVMVTSKMPMKVLSIQAPYFDGKDRIMLE